MSDQTGLTIFRTKEQAPTFPVFLVVDCSLSMAGPRIKAVNEAMPELRKVIDEDDSVGEVARVGVISFCETARVELPLSDLKYEFLPTLAVRGSGTNFAAAFRLATAEIETQIRDLGAQAQFYTPVVFFMTDGKHNASEDWVSPMNRLTSPEYKYHAILVAYGFGDATRSDFEKMTGASHIFLATSGDPQDLIGPIVNSIVGSIKTTSQSIHSGVPTVSVKNPDPNHFAAVPRRLNTN